VPGAREELRRWRPHVLRGLAGLGLAGPLHRLCRSWVKRARRPLKNAAVLLLRQASEDAASTGGDSHESGQSHAHDVRLDACAAGIAAHGISDHVRPFHDLRHTSITNSAAAGLSPAALMARAGHSDFKTTQGYIDLACVMFREEAQRLEERLWGGTGTKNRYQVPDSFTDSATAHEPAGVQNRPIAGDSTSRSGAGVEPTQPGATRPHRF